MQRSGIFAFNKMRAKSSQLWRIKWLK